MMPRMEETEPFNLERFWLCLGESAGWIVSLFGAPSKIAGCLILTRGLRENILAWLAPIEAFARRLLVIEAASLPRPNFALPKAASGRISTALEDAPLTMLGENEGEWRVRFKVWPGVTSAPCARRACEKPPPRNQIVFNAYPIARRIEALLRLAEDRTGALARIARRLFANPKAARIAFAPYRGPALCIRDMLATTQAEVDAALAAFANTS